MRKKVFIALRMAGIAGQEKLSGIFRFLGENHDWDIRLLRTAGEFTVAAVREAVKGRTIDKYTLERFEMMIKELRGLSPRNRPANDMRFRCGISSKDEDSALKYLCYAAILDLMSMFRV